MKMLNNQKSANNNCSEIFVPVMFHHLVSSCIRATQKYLLWSWFAPMLVVQIIYSQRSNHVVWFESVQFYQITSPFISWWGHIFCDNTHNQSIMQPVLCPEPS